MATLQELRSRVDSARDLRGVVKTMKAMAAVNLRQFEQAADALDEYHRTVEHGLQVALRERPRDDEVAAAKEDGAAALVVLGSDQGMVGSFNDRLAERAAGWWADRDAGGDEPRLLVMGAQAAVSVAAELRTPDVTLPVPATPEGIVATADAVVIRLERWRADAGVRQAWVVHNVPTTGAAYEPRLRQVLPPDDAWLERLERADWPGRVLPTVLRDPRELTAILIRHHLFGLLYRLIARSVAAENAARLAAMESAERNITERIEGLEASYRRQRQDEITEELLDVVAGYEALS